MGIQDRDYYRENLKKKLDKDFYNETQKNNSLQKEITNQNNYYKIPKKKPFWKMALEVTSMIGLIFLTLFLIKNSH